MLKRYNSPAGELILASLDDRLCMCDWVCNPHRRKIDRDIQYILQSEFREGTSDVIEETVRQLEEYFAGNRTDFDIPLLFCGTDFQCRIWEALLKIPYGETITYSEHARKIGNPGATRAVASAIASNKISIIMPCHRVIGSGNKLTGYAGGLEAKHYLLNHEKETLQRK